KRRSDGAGSRLLLPATIWPSSRASVVARPPSGLGWARARAATRPAAETSCERSSATSGVRAIALTRARSARSPAREETSDALGVAVIDALFYERRTIRKRWKSHRHPPPRCAQVTPAEGPQVSAAMDWR